MQLEAGLKRQLKKLLRSVPTVKPVLMCELAGTPAESHESDEVTMPIWVNLFVKAVRTSSGNFAPLKK